MTTIFADCATCGGRWRLEDLHGVQTLTATHSSPAEYELVCEPCHDTAVAQGEQDEERASLRGYSDDDMERI